MPIAAATRIDHLGLRKFGLTARKGTWGLGKSSPFRILLGLLHPAAELLPPQTFPPVPQSVVKIRFDRRSTMVGRRVQECESARLKPLHSRTFEPMDRPLLYHRLSKYQLWIRPVHVSQCKLGQSDGFQSALRKLIGGKRNADL